MNYAEKANRVWIIEVREVNPERTIWDMTWQPTGLKWYTTRAEAKADLPTPSWPGQQYRIRQYVRKP